jgi:ubiquinone/menaquinone biosynthesis C-methylase UbiE
MHSSPCWVSGSSILVAEPPWTGFWLAREHGAQVVAADIALLMPQRADANVTAANLTDQVSVDDADIRTLPYPDDSFDVVVAEAVTMFVGRR